MKKLFFSLPVFLRENLKCENFPFKSSFKLRKNPTAVGVVRLCVKGYDSVCCGTIYNEGDKAVSESKAFDLSLRGTILQECKDSEVAKL